MMRFRFEEGNSMKYLALAALLLSTSAMAQDSPATPADAPAAVIAPTTAPQPKTSVAPPQAAQKLFYFELDAAEVQSIGTALNELPKRLADPLILKLNKQLEIQAKIASDYAKVTTVPVKDEEDKPSRHRH
jgi:hypothetical protein